MARQFGATWWGKAWVEALEDSIMADDGRLARGRTYARQGRVSLPEILPGSVRAEVTGKEEYVADLSIRLLDEEGWSALEHLIAERSAHSAALLSGELPADLLSDAADRGVLIMPGAGDVLPDCSCPDWGEPCKHAAALAYLLADAIDQDPFVLLLLRGRGRSDLLESVRRLRSSVAVTAARDPERLSSGLMPARPSSPVESGMGVSAAQAYKRRPSVIPSALPAPYAPGKPIMLGIPAPIDSGIRLSELEYLIGDAAIRATQLLHLEQPSGLSLGPDADLARRAAHVFGQPGSVLEMASTTGVETAELLTMAIAWEQGGLAGLSVASDSWQPSPLELEPGRVAVGPRSRVMANAVSGNGVQLRLDKSGLWWKFQPDEELGWLLASQGFADPTEIVG